MLTKALTLTAALLFASPAFAEEAPPTVTADQALARLREGNQRFVGNQPTPRDSTAERQALASTQKPYAIVLSCSDSRVPPEVIFDKGLGELFVVRVAGNVPDPLVLGSIEYAAEHLGSPLIVVLGHERCGAVTATVKAHKPVHGNIGSIVKAIKPAVKAAKKAHADATEAELVEHSVDQNIDEAAKQLTKASPVIKKLVEEGKVRIVKAKYDLDEGTVRYLEP